MRLGDLDEKLVPRAASRLRSLSDSLRSRTHRMVAAGRGLDLRRLEALDDRFAVRGPLALFREVPQLALVVVGLVFLAGTGVAASQRHARAREQDPSAVVQAPPGPAGIPAARTLGPAAGEQVSAYLQTAAASLAAAERGSTGGTRVALMSFGSYRTAAQAAAMLSGVGVLRVYLAAGRDAAQLPVNLDSADADLRAELARSFTRIAQERLREEQSFTSLAASITVSTQQDRDFRDQYVAFARTTGVEARSYARGCACVYAAVVTGTPGQLRALRARAGVRVVQAAAAGMAISELQVLPLLPETKGAVPAHQAGSGPS
jgi:hypothetical protein